MEVVFDPQNTETDFVQIIVNAAGAVQDIRNGDSSADLDFETSARVCYNTLGHGVEAFANPANRILLQRGALWVCQRL